MNSILLESYGLFNFASKKPDEGIIFLKSDHMLDIMIYVVIYAVIVFFVTKYFCSHKRLNKQKERSKMPVKAGYVADNMGQAAEFQRFFDKRCQRMGYTVKKYEPQTWEHIDRNMMKYCADGMERWPLFNFVKVVRELGCDITIREINSDEL